MKEGLLTYELTNDYLNIGDYVQSIAAKQFLSANHDRVYIDREHLNSYDGDEVALIMNGWFLMTPKNFPPSKKIKPVLVSHHINISVHDHFSKSPEIIAFYKANEPVGCRDYFTMDFLKSLGVDVYYTGCLTLTLGDTFQTTERSDKVYFVDPRYKKHKGFVNKFKTALYGIQRFSTINAIRKKFKKDNKLKSWYKTIEFYKSYSQIFTDEVLINAEYVKHFVPGKQFKNEDEIFEFGENLLRKYAQANFVVTARIHCALPSLSMGTPTIYVDIPDDSDVSDCRLNGIKEYFHVVQNSRGILSTDLVKNGQKIDWNTKIENKKDFLVIKEKIKKNVIDQLQKIHGS